MIYRLKQKWRAKLHTYNACTKAHVHAIPVEVVEEKRTGDRPKKSMKNRDKWLRKDPWNQPGL